MGALRRPPGCPRGTSLPGGDTDDTARWRGQCPLALADHRELATGSDWDGLQPERDCCRLSDTQAARPGTAVTPRPGATRDFS